ncbi:MAG TPA: hypothetical protein VL688_00915 [Verrucomicrobiae bacterium]|nr:hypothetical protein [Verrucomicrobiae bacterium]
MKPKLFVGNLSFDTKDEELKKLFEPYGAIESVTVIVDKRTGKSKGYGFVQMVEGTDAARALELSGREFMGRDIVVTEAESPREGGGPRRGGRGGRGRGRQDRFPKEDTHDRSFYHRPDSVVTLIKAKPEKKSWWKKLLGLFAPPKNNHKPAAAASTASSYGSHSHGHRDRQGHHDRQGHNDDGSRRRFRRRRRRPRGNRPGNPNTVRDSSGPSAPPPAPQA